MRYVKRTAMAVAALHAMLHQPACGKSLVERSHARAPVSIPVRGGYGGPFSTYSILSEPACPAQSCALHPCGG